MMAPYALRSRSGGRPNYLNRTFIRVPLKKELARLDDLKTKIKKMPASEFCEIWRIFSKSIGYKLNQHLEFKNRYLSKLAAGKLFANTLTELRRNIKIEIEHPFQINYNSNFKIVEIEKVGEILQLPNFKKRVILKVAELQFADYERNQLEIYAENDVGLFIKNMIKAGDILLLYKDNEPLNSFSNIVRIGAISGNTSIILYPKLQESYQLPLLTFKIEYWLQETSFDEDCDEPNSLRNKEVVYVKKGYRTLLASRRICEIEAKEGNGSSSPRVISTVQNGSEPSDDSMTDPESPRRISLTPESVPLFPESDLPFSESILVPQPIVPIPAVMPSEPETPPPTAPENLPSQRGLQNYSPSPPNDSTSDSLPPSDLKFTPPKFEDELVSQNMLSSNDEKVNSPVPQDAENCAPSSPPSTIPQPSTIPPPSEAKPINNIIALCLNNGGSQGNQKVGLFDDYPKFDFGPASKGQRLKMPSQALSKPDPDSDSSIDSEIPIHKPRGVTSLRSRENSPHSKSSSPAFDLDFEISPSTMKELRKEIVIAPDDSTPIREGIRLREERKRKTKEGNKASQTKTKRKTLLLRFDTQENMF